MNLQFISDSTGKTTGVYIPIKEWNELKSKFKGIEQEGINIPDWHINLVRKRNEDYKSNPDNSISFDLAIDDIERDL
ncbi:hypothetical protein FO440_00460 [Mucilaginibacter corticis]|uniref:Addiction module component CHP02574 family protein n=1 Tax=Mucilaginibacter corticis TaxID=2597670 RepID=A0A556MSE0_9SPHI|nr:hypothetical protein [Mucilaginibacter corticis]TSJ42699.1 hypothetical protein FO440_00460 [Mucilaginibacter corticis]